MEFVLEIVIYLLIILGIMCITMVACTKDSLDNTIFTREKTKDTKVDVIIKCTNIEADEVKKIYWIISNGKFNTLYDIADSVKVYG